ncbi:proteasome subunit PSA3 (PSA3) [Vairimorpha necatrix]|uniref:Proteasome subunit PSA3 (PSA3) n=1 Tax=Vairimorpha necatrix TaxID=6039 RepID=A0AAX4JA29_9MICR|nr:Chain B, Proteasome subunit alpha type-3 [Vairimorpha necatrix]8ADN_P Chain P, Proteasome subunit alpha type-3 [Vairimorpha necatrix]
MSSNTFTEEGRLLQTEYAIKNVSKGGTIIGLVCKDGVILLGINKTELLDEREKIYKINPKVYVSVSGLFGDAMLLKKYGQVKAQDFLYEFDYDCDIDRICNFISEKKQLFTQYNSTRPFGFSFIYAGMKNNKFKLCSTDPSGTINEWKGVCFGENEDAINNGLRNDFPDEEMDMERGLFEIFKILSKVTECSAKDHKKYEILYFKNEESRFLEFEEIENILLRIEEEKNKK